MTNKWNDLVKQSVDENKRQAELEAWWNRPVPMPEPPPPLAKPVTLKHLDNDRISAPHHAKAPEHVEVHVTNGGDVFWNIVIGFFVVMAVLCAVLALFEGLS